MHTDTLGRNTVFTTFTSLLGKKHDVQYMYTIICLDF